MPNATNSVFPVSNTVPIPSNIAIKCEPNATIQGSGVSPMLMISGDNNVLIEGCTIDGSSDSGNGVEISNSSQVRLSHNVFQNFNVAGIMGQAWTDVEIDSNTFNGVGPKDENGAALYLYAQNGPVGSTRIKVLHNTCNNTGQGTGCMKFAASSSNTVTQITITGNILNVGSSSSHPNLGIEFYPTDSKDTDFEQFTVTGNLISTNSGSTDTSCISISGSYGVIGHNSLSNCQLFGIEFIGGWSDVTGNTLSHTGAVVWDGNSASHSGVNITDNMMVGSTGAAAIHLIATGHSLYTGIISHNILRSPAGSTAGILVQTISGGVDDIHIDDNMFDSFSSSQRAIDTEGSPAQVQIENNRFINDAGTGLFFNAGVNFTVRQNYFNGSTWMQNYGATLFSSGNIVNGKCCQ